MSFFSAVSESKTSITPAKIFFSFSQSFSSKLFFQLGYLILTVNYNEVLCFSSVFITPHRKNDSNLKNKIFPDNGRNVLFYFHSNRLSFFIISFVYLLKTAIKFLHHLRQISNKLRIFIYRILRRNQFELLDFDSINNKSLNILSFKMHLSKRFFN